MGLVGEASSNDTQISQKSVSEFWRLVKCRSSSRFTQIYSININDVFYPQPWPWWVSSCGIAESLLKLLVRRYSWMGKSQRIHDLWDEHGPLKFKQKYISTISTTKKFPLRIFPHPKKAWTKNSPKKPCLPKNLHRNLNPKNPRTFQFVSRLVSLVKSRNHGGVSMVYTIPFGWVEASVPHSAAVRLEDPSGQVGLFTINSTYNHRESKPRIPESKALFKAFINHHGPKKIIPFNKAWVFLRGG